MIFILGREMDSDGPEYRRVELERLLLWCGYPNLPRGRKEDEWGYFSLEASFNRQSELKCVSSYRRCKDNTFLCHRKTSHKAPSPNCRANPKAMCSLIGDRVYGHLPSFYRPCPRHRESSVCSWTPGWTWAPSQALLGLWLFPFEIVFSFTCHWLNWWKKGKFIYEKQTFFLMLHKLLLNWIKI